MTLEVSSKTPEGDHWSVGQADGPQRQAMEHLAPLIPNRRRSDGKERPRRDPREVLSGILWIQGRIRWIRTGAQWSELPDRYPPDQTCHRRFQQWRRASVIDRLLGALTRDLEAQSKGQGLN